MTAMTDRRRGDVRVDLTADDLGQGFARVVLVVADLIKELLERQALRRIDAGDLDDEQIERLGSALMDIEDQLAAVRAALEERRPGKEES